MNEVDIIILCQLTWQNLSFIAGAFLFWNNGFGYTREVVGKINGNEGYDESGN